ncbi:glycosyltransferase [Roseomonas sp. BN140053]|uniref:glycosyltransferase n=1 Tax=Roseomonas sp. BN140053 TaxID=3391898 RepID=UPI0039E73F7D
MDQVPAAGQRPLLLCFSHLRWSFVTQRPQHLLTRAARSHRVLYWEESLFAEGPPRLDRQEQASGVTVLVPTLPHGLDEAGVEAAQHRLLEDYLGVARPDVAWFYTPMAMGFAGWVEAAVTVYDCMDELSAFHGASPRLLELERQLFARADLVFTGGRSLYEAKRDRHRSVHCFPSSIDAAHFAAARTGVAEPADQAPIARPRIGFFGVVDERMDVALLGEVAQLRPDWQFVMLGPVVKIDPATLPRTENLHWLGSKQYAELPQYLAGWQAGFMPFALNEATRFISPTKTPEYLAAGVPVVSTPIADVVRPWGEDGLVAIAGDAAAVVAALDSTMAERSTAGDAAGRTAWLGRVDAALARISWDRTWDGMLALIRGAATAPAATPTTLREPSYV